MAPSSILNAGDQVVAGRFSPVLSWIFQSQEAKAREELPGPALLLKVLLRKAALCRLVFT